MTRVLYESTLSTGAFSSSGEYFAVRRAERTNAMACLLAILQRRLAPSGSVAAAWHAVRTSYGGR